MADPTEAVSGLIERIEAGPVEILLANLNERQKAFILKMRPHTQPQRMNALDWESVDACVDLGEDVWPNTYWFGGMRLTWLNGRAKRTFCFNADGLDVRSELLTLRARETTPSIKGGDRG